jgi:isochorismate synthase
VTESTALERWLDRGARRLLAERLGEALAVRRSRGARARAPVIVSVGTRLESAIDPSAIVVASRRADDPWFVLEQPDREGFALAALGSVAELRAQGPERFAELDARWRELAAAARCDPLDGPIGTGPVIVGGLAFAPEGGGSPAWSGFPPASLIVPELTLVRRAGSAWLTVNLLPEPDDTHEDLLKRVERRLGSLCETPLPLLDPAPTGRFRLHSPMPPSHYEEAVARAVARIRSGELQKVVLARQVEIRAPGAYDPGAILGVLREGFPSCFTYAVGRGESTFLGSSPELLIRRDGQRASTVALAGSARRSADPAVDDHLGERLLRSEKDREENAIVARRIARALTPYSVWVAAAPEPEVIRVANIQHLGAPIRAQLRRPASAIELAGVLHPTPAVGGEPSGIAERLIPALEGLDRGWYAGPVGFCDRSGDGEFLVALRCALLRGSLATCFAGAGIVADSDPAAELAETEVKLQALLPVLSG